MASSSASTSPIRRPTASITRWQRHARSRGLPCAMIEIRNDEISTTSGQQRNGRICWRGFSLAMNRIGPTKSGTRPTTGRAVRAARNSGEGEHRNVDIRTIPRPTSTEDIKVLHSMGYAQELERRLSAASPISPFRSRSSASCRAASTRWRRRPPAPAASASASAGWSAASSRWSFAVAMAQISSAYPTAGGLYHWGSILGNRGTGWVTAWLNLLGLITVLGAINVGTWTFFIGAFGADARHREQPHHADDLPDHHHRRSGADQSSRHQAHRQADRLLRLPDLRRLDPDRASSACSPPRAGISAGCSPSPTTPARLAAMSGRQVSNAWVFRSACLLPIYTITGYDASAHTSEETHEGGALGAARQW